MSTAMLAERSRLIDQYHRATSHSGRWETAERKRFVTHLLERLNEHQRLVSTSLRDMLEPTPMDAFLRSRAARQGRQMAHTFSFILDELQARVGAAPLAEDLMSGGDRLGLATARRISSQGLAPRPRLAAIRVCHGEQHRDTALHGSLLDVGECARHDIECEAGKHGFDIAVAVDNCGIRTAYAVGVEISVQIEAEGGVLQRSGLSIFRVIPSIEARRRRWIPLRGVDLLAEARSEIAADISIRALRLLIRRV